jgi:hypothetical protein
MKRFTMLSVFAAFGLLWVQTGAWAQQGDATTYTQQTFYDWFNKYKDAKPEFKPGDVLTHADLEKVRPFMLPGYFEQFQKWTDLKMEVGETYHVTPHKAVLDCNEKFQRQVKLAADGALENYVCGFPFANEDIKEGDPQAGLKAAWNYDKRWWYRGLFVVNAMTTWLRFGGSHMPPELEMPPHNWMGDEVKIKPEDWQYDMAKIYGGGGKFERSLGCFYHRAYLSHLPMFEKSNYQVPGVTDADEVHWKEFTGFFSPYDVRGTAFIIARYNNPRRTDDGWAYVPALRRVRRISAETKSDSLMGTEHTIEDFYSFSGRVLEWNWKFHGWKDMLVVHAKSKWDDDVPRYRGPDGWLTDDVWQIRKVLVLERIPQDPRHPYASVFMTIDAETWEGSNMVAFDRKGKLWKIWQWGYMWSEGLRRYTDMTHGRSSINWRNAETVDVQNGRGNLWTGYGSGLPDFSVDFITKLYDLNRLTELHR